MLSQTAIFTSLQILHTTQPVVNSIASYFPLFILLPRHDPDQPTPHVESIIMRNRNIHLDEGIRFLQCPTNKTILETIDLKRLLPRLHHELLLRRDNARTWVERDGIEYLLERHLPNMAEYCNSTIESVIVGRLALAGAMEEEGGFDDCEICTEAEGKSGMFSGDSGMRRRNVGNAWTSVERHVTLREMAARRRRWLEDVYDVKIRMDCKSLYVHSMAGLDELAALLAGRARECCDDVPEKTQVFDSNTSSSEVFSEYLFI